MQRSFTILEGKDTDVLFSYQFLVSVEVIVPFLAIAHFNQYNMSQWLCAKKSNAIFVKIVDPIDLIKTILSVTNI